MNEHVETPVASVRQAPPNVVSVDLNPFGEEALERPADFAPVWLDAGPIFWLSSLGAYGVARHAELMAVHKDWEHFCSGGGVGLANRLLEPEGAPRSLLLEADPPEHTHSRSVMREMFSPNTLQPLFARWCSDAEELVQGLVARGRFDAASDLAAPYAALIVPREIGLKAYPDELVHGGIDGVYPFNERGRVAPREETIRWINENSEVENLAPGGWGAAVHAAADRGECTHTKASVLVRSLITAGVFNTVLALGNMINAFVEHPDQWKRLREEPSLIRGAIEEVMRWDPPGIHLFRTTAKPTPFGDVTLPAGEKVLMQFVAANRDPRRWTDPDRFDITRNATGHFGFGLGIHQCLGQMVARQQMTAILEALLRRVESMAFFDKPVRRLNNISHGFESLPIKVVPA